MAGKKSEEEKKIAASKREELLIHPGMDVESLTTAIMNCLRYEESKDQETAVAEDYLQALAWAMKHRLVDRWIETQKHYHHENIKSVYYMSLEFLTGQALTKNMINMGLYKSCKQVFDEMGFDLSRLSELEPDAALGNGGLGRLAACYLDSMATVGLPAMGYGLRYEYGIFKQGIENGYQIEQPDNWLKDGTLWEIRRPEHTYYVGFEGHVKKKVMPDGSSRMVWKPKEQVMALAYDTPYAGYNTYTVNTLRLWSAEPTQEFNLEYFSTGNYLQAIEDKAYSKAITRVLYPNDAIFQGLELRLKQEYFLVSATLQDIVSHFKKKETDFGKFPEFVAVQLNDTHPSLTIPELMRILVDLENHSWDQAWDIVVKTCSYTNHTILPEALERWPIELMEKLLPRHLMIIKEINKRFVRHVANLHPDNRELLKEVSIIEEEQGKINMGRLSVVGSHKINGVSELHTQLIKETLFSDFYKLYPDRFINKTNGITPRRWLKQCNMKLSDLISEHIGDSWVVDLYKLKGLIPLAKDKEFRKRFREVKQSNKMRMVKYVRENLGIEIHEHALFDTQVKRIHEYKRQLLNVLHVITLYNELKESTKNRVPRVVFFGGKAAPAYETAKLIIKLINTVATVINNDETLDGFLKVVFVPDYKVSIAEKVIPATDLSEQISTAGYEASGTGNMKFALNGAVTIGTLDGANIEIKEEVGDDNIFIFGMTADEVCKKKKNYRSRDYYEKNPKLKQVIDMIGDGYFNLEEPDLFKPIVKELLDDNDTFLLLADYQSYIDCQKKVEKAYQDEEGWTKKAILNTANMGKFSSDRAVLEYANEIWDVKPYEMPVINANGVNGKAIPK